MPSSPPYPPPARASSSRLPPILGRLDDAPPPRKRLKLTGPNYFKIILNSDSEDEPRPSTSVASSSRYAVASVPVLVPVIPPPPPRSLPPPHGHGPTPSASTSPVPDPCPAPPKIKGETDAEYLRRQLCLHISVPVDLWAIADPPDGQKPFASLPTLVKLAIHGSPERRLTLQGICDALVDRFEWFRVHRADEAWKNSVRHNLSLNKVFRKIPRNVTAHLGKGCYWQLDLSQGEGHKRPRKRGKKVKPTEAGSSSVGGAKSDDVVMGSSDQEHEIEVTMGSDDQEHEIEVEVEQDELDEDELDQEPDTASERSAAEVLSAFKTNVRVRSSPHQHPPSSASMSPPLPPPTRGLLLFQPYGTRKDSQPLLGRKRKIKEEED